MDTTAIADRVHFAALIMFHYLFPPVTIGLGLLIATLKVMQVRRGEGYDGLHARAARFWGKLFLLNYGAGWRPGCRWSSSSAPIGRASPTSPAASSARG